MPIYNYLKQLYSYTVVLLVRSVMKELQERAKDFVVIAAAQDTVADNSEIVLYLLMLLSQAQEDSELEGN